MRFNHEVIDDSPPCGRLFVCQPVDLTDNGRPDLIVGGAGSETLPILGTGGIPLIGRFFRRLENDLFWYENPGWKRHTISSASDLQILGSTIGDLTGNGRVDLIVGQGIGGRNIYWFEQPSDPREQWTKHLIASDFDKYHDLTFGDVDNDGEPEIVGASQESEVLFYYDVPDDPYRTPWPSDSLTVIARETNVEGLEIVDIDGDGQNELIAGTSIFRQHEPVDDRPTVELVQTDGGNGSAEPWYREPITTGWDWTRVAVGDLDDDGDLEVVFSEGDSPLLGSRPGRVAWFDPPNWTEHVLRDDFYCPHSLQLADFDGNGRLDVYVAEMGLGENDDDAEHVVFRNLGDGQFEETVIDSGTPTHEAKAVDVDGDGRTDIIGKSYEPNAHVDVWYNEG